MRCPNCNKNFHPQFEPFGREIWEEDMNYRTKYLAQYCPSCHSLLILQQDLLEDDIVFSEIIYPENQKNTLPNEIPKSYREEFYEAKGILSFSAKASAALSRRILQKILREELNIHKRDLSQEIDDFISNSKAPSYLIDAIDAIRQIGNFAAHPMKYQNTGEIVEVESGEAEWLVEVLQSLFDFVFVQPARLEARRASLNLKLKELGKPELKGSS